MLPTQVTFFCWQTLAKWPILLQSLHCAFKALQSFMCLVLTNWWIASVAFFCGKSCFFVSNFFYKNKHQLYFTSQRDIFSSPAATSARFQFLIIAFSWMFLFVVSITIWSGIAYSSAQSLSHSQKLHVSSAALTLLQKALKVSFLTCSLNLKFCIIGFSIGL